MTHILIGLLIAFLSQIPLGYVAAKLAEELL